MKLSTSKLSWLISLSMILVVIIWTLISSYVFSAEIRPKNETNLPYHIEMAVLELESGFNPLKKNTNKNGTVDWGVSQTNSCNWEWMQRVFGDDWNPLNTRDSLNAFAFIMNHYQEDNIHQWLTNYNRGRGGAKKFYNKYGHYKSAYAKLIIKKSKKYFGKSLYIE